jgi:hypothetical protein
MASERAVKRLERFRQSKANVKPREIKALYLAFGFVIEPGKRHDIVTHPNYPELFGSIPRHQQLANYVADQAIKLVEKVLVLEQSEEERDDRE